MYISAGGANCFKFILNLYTLVIGSELWSMIIFLNSS